MEHPGNPAINNTSLSRLSRGMEIMKYDVVLKNLLEFFQREKIDHAVIGAFALKAYGYLRATQDIDFAVPSEAQEKIIRHLEDIGYETIYRSRGFSNHWHALRGLGRIDFIYVEGETANQLFAESRPLLELEGYLLPVVKVEHLIALKVFAMKNDPERVFQEMADLQHLLRVPEIDLSEVRGYFERYGQQDKFKQLTGKGT